MQAEPRFIVSLSDTSAGLLQVGGKGASLARLAAAGLPVPPGFHITTAAYRQFVTAHGLQERILEVAAAAVPDQPATLEEASAQIGELFVQREMPEDIANAIRRAYAGLGRDDVPVAVRSSGLAGQPRAGQSVLAPETRTPSTEGGGGQRGASPCAGVCPAWNASIWPAKLRDFRMVHSITFSKPQARMNVALILTVQAVGNEFGNLHGHQQ